jgi:hypothetical protein
MFAVKKISTFQDALALLNCRRLPARLTTGEVAVLLGFQEHDLAPLVAAKLLVPLGKPAPNSPKYFAAVEIDLLAQDREWLDRATKTLAKYWQNKNRRKKSHETGRDAVNPRVELLDIS